MEVALAVTIMGLAALAFSVGRWWSVVLPLGVVPLFYLGLQRRWWGHSLGDGWAFVMVFVLALGVGAAWSGWRLRSLTRRR